MFIRKLLGSSKQCVCVYVFTQNFRQISSYSFSLSLICATTSRKKERKSTNHTHSRSKRISYKYFEMLTLFHVHSLHYACNPIMAKHGENAEQSAFWKVFTSIFSLRVLKHGFGFSIDLGISHSQYGWKKRTRIHTTIHIDTLREWKPVVDRSLSLSLALCEYVCVLQTTITNQKHSLTKKCWWENTNSCCSLSFFFSCSRCYCWWWW